MNTLDQIEQTHKSQIIVDLDGTICDILVDWTNWEKGLAELFSKYDHIPIRTLNDENLDQNTYVAKYKEPLLTELRDFIQKYETQYTTGFAPVQATVTLLKQLKGMDLYIWSANSEKTTARAMEELNLTGYFKKYVGRESLIMQKPDPEGFNIIHALNPELPKSAYIFIGNAPNDYKAAVNAGIEYINVNEIVIED